jgi:membrane-associated phospholipid phosphatase
MSRIITQSADIGQFLIPILASVPILYTGVQRKDYSETAWLAVSVIVQKAVVEFFKYLLPRQRPNGNMKSFPSGHTAGAFLGVGLLATRYGHSLPTFCGLACAMWVGFSRYLSKHHHPSDIAAGAAIGLASGALVTYART